MCETPGCQRPAAIRGYCEPCYRTGRRNGTIEPKLAKHHIDPISVAHGRGHCCLCGDVPVKLGKTRWVCASSRHGARRTTAVQLLTAQGGRCAICSDPITASAPIDHDHTCCSGRAWCSNCIRGLLCEDCNLGLGRFRDDPARLLAAVRYLENGARPLSA